VFSVGWIGKRMAQGAAAGDAEDDHILPKMTLDLNTEGLTAEKVSVIEQLAYKNKVFIIVLQETHGTTADKLVIPNFSLAGSVLMQESRPCHICSRAVGMVNGRSVSGAIRDRMVVRRRRRI